MTSAIFFAMKWAYNSVCVIKKFSFRCCLLASKSSKSALRCSAAAFSARRRIAVHDSITEVEMFNSKPPLSGRAEV
ncbi:unnamed protein product [Schistosoma mattheei]|uniref:Uncharacterized protein n=1 Tax=Schistosoma mattheei TaxID=31246 RepID=A0A3P8KFV2_9TREM|nr:unnamed protein product [Schistosoma mattheei]